MLVNYRIKKDNAAAIRAHMFEFVKEPTLITQVNGVIGELTELSAKYSKAVEVMVREFFVASFPDNLEVLTSISGRYMMIKVVVGPKNIGVKELVEAGCNGRETLFNPEAGVLVQIDIEFGMSLDEIEERLREADQSLKESIRFIQTSVVLREGDGS